MNTSVMRGRRVKPNYSKTNAHVRHPAPKRSSPRPMNQLKKSKMIAVLREASLRKTGLAVHSDPNFLERGRPVGISKEALNQCSFGRPVC